MQNSEFRIETRTTTDRFVLEHRSGKNSLDPQRAYAALREEEPDATGALIPTAVVFLTNRECPFRCVFCDLWKNTLDETVPSGAIPHQIREAVRALPAARAVKLYNAGSFFDPQAIPPADDDAIVRSFERVIVESHPAFLAGGHAERCLRFRDRLTGRLEVAIGLETANERVLERLNKRMTLESFRRAAEFLRTHDIDVRVFILLAAPYMRPEEDVEWACRSIDEAVACGASVCSIIPTRSGNGAVEALVDAYHAPSLSALEHVAEYGLSTPARVFVDLWDIERLFTCECSSRRADRLRAINREQRVPESVSCSCVRRGRL
jgi:radical SAM enzyme (TIGR01210 family)